MGCSAIAKCPCGYESEPPMIGGGMGNFEVLCGFPAYCAEGKHLVQVNMFEKPLECPDGHSTTPVPYNDKTLVKKLGKRFNISA